MTGYGRGARDGRGFSVTVEVRALNHRFREIVVRGPREWMALEDELRRIVAGRVARGRVDVYVGVIRPDGGGRRAVLDVALARQMKEAVDSLAADLGLPESVGVGQILSLPGVVAVEEIPVDPEEGWEVVKGALEEALDMLLAVRSEEGGRLETDLVRRLGELSRLVEEIRQWAPVVREEYRRRLGERLREAVPEAAVDELRLIQEVALMAERAGIEEELVRLSSHIGQFRAALGAEEAVGRRLDFLLQEMHRELNTIGAKSGDVEISRRVVDAKTLLEQMREQVQNIE